jgi:outer membrane protein TolC
MIRQVIIVGVAGIAAIVAAHAAWAVESGRESMELSRTEAERDAMRASNQLKAFVENTEAATEQADSQYATLFPRLTIDGSYQYQTNVPTVAFGPSSFPVGAHNNYNVGPTLSYTLWDTFAARDQYHGYERLAQSRDEDRRNAAMQLLLQTRTAYVHVQETLDELKLVEDSLNLSRAQNRDIRVRVSAGAASHLDRVESDRDVLSYQIQFTQKQADLSMALKDLLALTQDRAVSDLSHPGPPGGEKVTLELKMDSLQKSLADDARVEISEPDDSHPQIHSEELLAQSNEFQASGVKSGLYPTLTFSARAALEYPNEILLQQVNQNTFSVNLSVPIFEMNQTLHRAHEKSREADSARYQKDQIRIDIQRDFAKSKELLASLREQQLLAEQDVENSAEAARLYYEQYKAGKIYLIDVQTANNRALLSKVSKARIDAQVLNEIDNLRALSGKELSQ